MLKNKMKSKLGFTLAELLIVVAILAVLVAVAVPLFVGALKKADEAVIKANQRAVRAQAAAEIMLNDTYKDKEGPFYVTGTIKPDGEIESITITDTKPSEWNTGASTAETVYVEITKTSVT